MMNDSRFKEQLLSWILASLEDDETQYIRSTLEELARLKQPDDSLAEKILTLIEFEGEDIVAHRIREAAVELSGKWGLEQARPLLVTLTSSN